MENVATYSEARSEYTKQLATFIVPALVQWFQQMWQRNSANRQQAMYLFQTELEEIPRWNQDRITDEVRVLLERTGCDYMEELMTAVFVAHTKVLTAVRLSARQKKLSITVPKLDHFIHRIFREAARSFWKAPFLFRDPGDVVERQKNLLQVEVLATEALTSAVRSLLPVKQILKDYLEDDGEEVEEETIPANTLAQEEEKVAEEDLAAAETVAAPVVAALPPETPALEVKEVAPVSPEVPAPAPVGPEVPVGPKVPEPTTPSIVKIDTETAVHFADYDAVFDETKGAPEMRYAPKEDDLEEEDLEDFPADGTLDIDEESVAPVSDDDVEDLDAAPTKVKPPVESIEDDDMVVLE